MQKIIPFKKEVVFKTSINEILSIAIDKDLNIDNNAVKGLFKISGEYSINETDKEPFNIEIPYLSYFDEVYDTSNVVIDIDDFYYEIVENKTLVLNIDISVDNLQEMPLIEREESIDEVFEYNDTSLNEAYMTYRIYIVREEDTIESIISKYQITKELLAKYNTLNNISIGDKLIIPNEKNK